ncbi:hypothetical protein [Allosphingosinicella sp.]|uniref:hypothetical protein n=1 Tax=Allosphingosinicella sp. TaxID=2823234 RepID=UPI002F0CA148
MPRPFVLLAFLAASGCAGDRLCNPSEFVCWDAMSDARNSAAEACGEGRGAVQIEGTEGTHPDDYVCTPDPPPPQR